MNEIDTSLFLALNASAASPGWVPALARAVSMELPKLVFAGMLGSVFFMDARRRQDLLVVLVAMLVAWICARLIQHAFPVQRPHALGIGTAWLVRAPSAGMPSTHASVAFAFAVTIALRSQWAPLCLAALILAALIAWSRVCLGLHFPSQVIAGAILGASSAWVCCRAQGIRISRWRHATPIALRDTALVDSRAGPPGKH